MTHHIKLICILFISVLMAVASFIGAAQAQQGQVRIHGEGIGASILGANNTQAKQIAARLGAPIGIIESTNSPAAVRHVDGTTETLKPGSTIYRGDQLITGDAGSAVLFMKDQSTVSMDANSQLLMDELIYDPAGQRGSEIVSLIKGVAVFASGNIAKMQPDAMTIHTPVATIGIRGTTFGIHYRTNRDLTVVLAEDADGSVGEISIRNQAGAVTLNQKFHATNVAGLNIPPTAPAAMPSQNFMNKFNDAIMQMPARTKRMLNQPPVIDRDPMRQLREELLRRR